MYTFLFLTDFGSGLLSRDFAFNSMSGPLVCESIDIIDDDNFEGTETFFASISGANFFSGTLQTTMDAAEITITDRDGKYISCPCRLSISGKHTIMVFKTLTELV